MKTAITALLVAAAAAGCGGTSDDPCKDVTGTCIAIHDGDSLETIQSAMIDATPGTTIAFGAGTWDLDRDLSLAIDDITIQGEGMDVSILSWANQTSGAQGLYVTGNHFSIHDIGMEDAHGDLLKLEGSDGVHIQRVRAEWTGGPNEANGAYGLYPVQCANVLIEDSVAKGASDTGIYVGQSTDVIIRNNDCEYNVAGIEIENTSRADVYMNTSTHNTGGILVFNLPGLQVENASGTRVYMNTVVDNNTMNFAPAGNIVGQVPTGSGFIGLAAHNVEIFGNTFDNHKSMNLGIASYTITGLDPKDATYDVYPDTFYIHDNTFTGTSDNPTGPLGALLVLTMSEIMSPPIVVPDMIWDGIVDPALADSTDPNQLDADHRICFQNNGDADWANLAYPNGDSTLPSRDTTAYDCSHPALPAVTVAGF